MPEPDSLCSLGKVFRHLTRKSKEAGIQFLFRTSGQRILRGADGKVNGVVAATRDGKEFQIKTKSVILCPGSFVGNKELLKKYLPYYYDEDVYYHTDHLLSNTGDGLQMAADAGADLAGVSRMQYPPTTRVIRVMCSGRVTSGFILEAFRFGADGVLVTGCHPGDCHYISGNQTAVVTVEKTTQLLALLGLEAERLHLEWISAAEGARFARIMTEFTEQIRALGRSPLGRDGQTEQCLTMGTVEQQVCEM